MTVNVPVRAVNAFKFAVVEKIEGNTITVDRSGYMRVGDIIYATSPGYRVFIEDKQ